MADRFFSVDVDTAPLIAALNAIPDAIRAHLNANAKVTADNIQREAQARIRRATGATGDAITVEETRNGDGYVVFVGNNRTHIGRFLEFGTRYMAAQPYLFVSARLEEGSHDRRAREAVQDAIAEKGLGD